MRRSRRQEREALAEQLRLDGCTWEDVAQELRRREPASPLLALRWAHGLTQEEAARRYNRLLTSDPGDREVTFQTVSDWESWQGTGRPPPMAGLNRFAQIYQVRTAFLLDAKDFRHLDHAYQRRPQRTPEQAAPDPAGEPIATGSVELLDQRTGAQHAGTVEQREPLSPEQLAAFAAPVPAAIPNRDGQQAIVVIVQGTSTMERRRILHALAAIPGAAVLNGPAGDLLAPDAREIVGRALQRPDTTGPEILEPISTLIMGCRRLDDILGGHAVVEPVTGIIRLVGELLPIVQKGVRQPLFSLAASAAQLAGWIAVDGNANERALKMHAQALEWATAADDPALIAYVWCCMSNHARMNGDAVGAVGAAEAARRIATRESTILRAWVEGRAGRAYALAGNPQETARAMNEAAELLAAAEAADTPDWLYHFHAENLTGEHGSALIDVGHGTEAAELLGDAIDRLPATYPRQRASYLANQANAFLIAGDVRQAGVIGTEAVLLGRQTGSAWTVAKVRRFYGSFDEKALRQPDVRALGDLLREDAPA